MLGVALGRGSTTVSEASELNGAGTVPKKNWDGRYRKKLAGRHGTLEKKLAGAPASAWMGGRHGKKKLAAR